MKILDVNRWLVFAVAVFLGGCREDHRTLTAQELASELNISRKIAFERFHISGTATLRRDGSFEATVPHLGRDTGTWWLDGDKICSRWANFRQGQELCAVVGQSEDGQFRGKSPISGSFLGNFRFLN
ncbi:hypothetical protein RUESEDTHA_01180 [Ruegeria sp. THAF57]|uniref:hypothetical protein n=1 Tax=Ruegeria sp. THAF57 TaxID=2744555 RepID=UPI0015DD9688|nr:hypothetical protein [Ruegeria sp. THAF57]CAD0184301.1 hypothetical protein RUESEDTHA_01180 [Ruegeria sp. THAF57]